MIDPAWLHVTLAVLGPSATAPADLDDTVAVALSVPALWAARPQLGELKVLGPGMGRTGVRAELHGSRARHAGMVGSYAAQAAVTAGVAGADVTRPYTPHLGVAYEIGSTVPRGGGCRRWTCPAARCG